MEVNVLSKIVYKGKELTYNELKRTSQIRFNIQCPECGVIYETCKQYLEDKGSTECQKCRMTKRFSKSLPIGYTCGYWTILAESSKKHYYTCRCKCGTVKDIEGTLLRNNRTKSCGCFKREPKKPKEPEIDPTRFLENNSGIDLVEPPHFRGHLINYDDLKPQSNLTIKIRCSECKTEFETSKYRITSNKHSMCQKCAMKDKFSKSLPIGATYERWTVIDHGNKSGKSKCKCTCGKVSYVDNYALITGASRSCGCLAAELAKQRAFDNFSAVWEANKGVYLDVDPRSTKEYGHWRKFILTRDKGMCVRCGSKEQLNTHHIIAVRKDPSLALAPRNGICLCKKCHVKLHSKYKISADRQLTNSYIKEVNSKFDLDGWTDKYPNINNI